MERAEPIQEQRVEDLALRRNGDAFVAAVAAAKVIVGNADRIVGVLQNFEEPVSPSKIAEIIGGDTPIADVRSLRGKISAELTKLIRGPDASVKRVGRAMYQLEEQEK